MTKLILSFLFTLIIIGSYEWLWNMDKYVLDHDPSATYAIERRRAREANPTPMYVSPSASWAINTNNGFRQQSNQISHDWDRWVPHVP
jgi:hypothetical protein